MRQRALVGTDLLSDLQGRLPVVVTARDLARGLLEAVAAVGSNLELEAVLRRMTSVPILWITVHLRVLPADHR